MAKKGIRVKLTEEQKEQRKQEKREKALGFAPKRLTKYMKVSKHVGNIASYPLTDSEKKDIIEAVTKAYQGIISAFEGKKKTEEFKFSQPE